MQNATNTKARNLILITNHFPYGAGEAFVNSEFEHVCKRFDRVYILSRNVVEGRTREATGVAGIYRMNPVSNFTDYLRLVFLILKQFTTVCRFLGEELNALRNRKRRATFPIFMTALHDLSKSLLIAFRIRNIIKENDLQENITLYSYWMNNAALATLFLKSQNPCIVAVCRAHGGDIFEFRQRHGYLSFRSTIIRHINKVFSISEAGAEQLKRYSTQEYHNHILVARLGTRNGAMLTKPNFKPRFTVVSCSFIVPVKRLTLLIDALQHIQLEIQWIHIGDGPLLEETKRYADSLLDNKMVSYSFRGFHTRDELQHFYLNTPVHLFINTSSSEGIPVSIMEAQSYGIPALAPEVGGIPEIVNASNGALFPVEASPSEIASAITQILTLPEKEYLTLRNNAFETWKSCFNADLNFPTFVDQILALQQNETE
jgi:glycosyltransferase involved in cell wall biosynthesis